MQIVDQHNRGFPGQANMPPHLVTNGFYSHIPDTLRDVDMPAVSFIGLHGGVDQVFFRRGVTGIAGTGQNPSGAFGVPDIAFSVKGQGVGQTADTFGNQFIPCHFQRKDQHILAAGGDMVGDLQAKGRFAQRTDSAHTIQPCIQAAVEQAIESRKACRIKGGCFAVLDRLPETVQRIGGGFLLQGLLFCFEFFGLNGFYALEYPVDFSGKSRPVCHESLISVLIRPVERRWRQGVIFYTGLLKTVSEALYGAFYTLLYFGVFIVVQSDNKRLFYPPPFKGRKQEVHVADTAKPYRFAAHVNDRKSVYFAFHDENGLLCLPYGFQIKNSGAADLAFVGFPAFVVDIVPFSGIAG